MSGPDDKSTLTIKFGDRFDAPWYVASGNPRAIRDQVVEFLGENPEDWEGKSLLELAVHAASKAQSDWAIRSHLGGTDVTSRVSRASGQAKSKAEAAPAKENQPLLNAIEASSSEGELMRVYAENVDTFGKDKELQVAFKAKKASLA